MDENIYKPPQSELVAEVESDIDLASRWKRLWASMIDGVTIMVVTMPVMYLTGGFEGVSKGIRPSITYSLLVGALGLITFFAINGNSLIKSGKTLGKRALGIKIVDLNGDLPTFKGHLIKRYAAFFLPGQIPIAGQIFSSLNILFIFGKQRRCIHDYIAGTKVVEG